MNNILERYTVYEWRRWSDIFIEGDLKDEA